MNHTTKPEVTEAQHSAADTRLNTLLLLAAQEGNCEQIEVLVKVGAQAHALSADGERPLHIAARHNRLAAIKCLKEVGAHLDAADIYGFTPLHIAAREADIETIDWLLNLGASPYSRDNDGLMPFTQTAYREKADAFGILVPFYWHSGDYCDEVKKLADTVREEQESLKHFDEFHYHYLDEEAKNLFSVESLEKHAMYKKKIVQQRNQLLLFSAVQLGDIVAIKQIIADGADINAKSERGDSALHAAVGRNRIKAIICLAKLGIDLDSADNSGNTAVHIAAIQNMPEAIICLHRLGASIEAQDCEWKWRPLHRAAMIDDPAALNCLLTLGAQIDALAKNENTALHQAASSDKPETLLCLYRAGANLEIRNRHGLGPFDDRRHFDKRTLRCIDLVRKITRLYSDPTPDPNVLDPNGSTLLILAVQDGFVELVTQLLEDPLTDVNIKEFGGNTALHRAAQLRYLPDLRGCLIHEIHMRAIPKIVKLFLRISKTDVFLKNDAGKTALQCALDCGNNGVVNQFKVFSRKICTYWCLRRLEDTEIPKDICLMIARKINW